MTKISSETWKQKLEGILGTGNLSFQPDGRHEGLWASLSPKAVAIPENREQVCELIRLASSERLRVLSFGSGTKLRLGGIPQPVDLAISLERLNKICDYPASDLTISAEAGVPIRAMSATLTAKGQMLPLDVPFAERATIGGTIAVNINGPRRLAYGSWRDIVLGVQFVTAEGKLAKGGGKVVKNVAGYDIPKLMIGSFGTLAVILEITFKVFPIPPASLTIALQFPSAELAAQAALRIVHSALLPQALDLADSRAGALVNHPELSSAPCTLLAGVAGPEPVLERFERELPALVRPQSLERFKLYRGEDESKLWNAIQEMPAAFLKAHPGGMVVKASIPLSKTGGFIQKGRAICDEQGLAHATLARAGSGIVYLHLWPESVEQDIVNRPLVTASDRLIREAEMLGGRAIVEWCPSELKSNVNLWGTLGDDFTSMRQLKAALDSQKILNPGRFYGGI